MSISYAPDEDPATILLERTFLAADFINGVGYGIQLILFTFCAVFLWKARKARRQSIYLLAYITVLLALESLYEAVQARTVEEIYINNRNFPDGPWAYFLATQNLPVNVIFIASLFTLTFLADLLVMWRCWVIWAASGTGVAYAVLAFPSLVLLASFVMGTLWTLQSSKPGLSFYSALPLAYGTSYYAISLGANIILTLLIVLRLLMHRRRILATLPEEHAKDYVSLVAIIVESAALYSTFSLIFLVTYALDNPTNQIFLAVAHVSQIANYLIIFRVAQGRAWRRETLVTGVSTLAFKAQQNARSSPTMGHDITNDSER